MTTRHKTRKNRALLAVVLVVGAASLAASRASASHPEASLTGSNFEIDEDANLKVDDPAPSVDWASFPTDNTNPALEIRGEDLATGQDDDSYKGGVKEDTVCPDEVTGSIPNNKSDLLTFHGHREAGTASNPLGFFEFAWSRVSDPSGTTLMDFEFNKATTACPQGPNVERSVGDVLVEYAIDQGGARADITAREWDGTEWGDPIDLDAPSPVCGGNPCAVGTINDSVIPALESDGLGLKQPRTFGEAQLDLRFLLSDPTQCQAFGSMMVKSRSSDAFTSQLKDFIRPISVPISNCGRVIIHKQTIPDEDPNTTSFGYTHNIINTPVIASPFNLTDDGTQTFDAAALNQAYVVDEATIPAGWVLQDIDCSASVGVVPVEDEAAGTASFTLDASTDVAECTYTNQAQADLHFVKDAERDGVDFDYVASNLTPATFTLQNGGQQDYLDLDPGTYGATETIPEGWDLVSQDCDNGDTADAVTLVAGDDVTCTFVNVIERGALALHKSAKHAAAPGGVKDHSGVTFTITNATNGTNAVVQTDASGNACVSGLPVSFLDGDYTITETLPAGYASDDLDQTYTVVEDTTCANAVVAEFVNIPLTDLSVSVNSQIDGGTASTISCVNDATPPAVVAAGTTNAVGDGSASVTGLRPGTYTCTVVIDP